jgi:rRNA maturation endonuclease Nob1
VAECTSSPPVSQREECTGSAPGAVLESKSADAGAVTPSSATATEEATGDGVAQASAPVHGRSRVPGFEDSTVTDADAQSAIASSATSSPANDDESGWVTPTNIAEWKAAQNGVSKSQESKPFVACVTTDYAMQVGAGTLPLALLVILFSCCFVCSSSSSFCIPPHLLQLIGNSSSWFLPPLHLLLSSYSLLECVNANGLGCCVGRRVSDSPYQALGTRLLRMPIVCR